MNVEKYKDLSNHENLVYGQIKDILTTARTKAYTVVNFSMVEAYWLIGKQIIEAQGNEERAEYGEQLLKFLSKCLTKDFGKGFDESNLRNIRQFYLTFPIRDTLRHELGWSHYRLIMTNEGDNPPIGIILCADTREVVDITKPNAKIDEIVADLEGGKNEK